MEDLRLRFGIPDVELACPKGGSINPSTFVGHQLVVLFLPTDLAASISELADYASYAAELSATDAWILNIARKADSSLENRPECHALASDPDDKAWHAFLRLTRRREKSPREDGAVYLFGRGGGLQGFWPGAGHSADVIRELRQPSAW